MKDEDNDSDSDNKLCVICLEQFERNEQLENDENDENDDTFNRVDNSNIIVLECKHIYHKKCFYAWANFSLLQSQRVTCPICRSEINRNREHITVTIHHDNEDNDTENDTENENEINTMRVSRMQRLHSCLIDIFWVVIIFSSVRFIVVNTID